MDTENFLGKVNLRKTTTDFLNWTEKSTWDKPKILKLEHTAFRNTHRVERGRNRASKTIELSTVVSEVNSILLERSKYGALNIYLDISISKGQTGFTNNKQWFIKLRKNNKEYAFTVQQAWNASDINVYSLQDTFGRTAKTKEEYQAFVYLGMYDFEDFAKEQGFKLITFFEFTEHISIHNFEYIKYNNKSLEIGYLKVRTYNSLPATIKISKVNKIKTISLRELGVEKAGYYDFSEDQKILPEQLQEVKKFMQNRKRKGSK